MSVVSFIRRCVASGLSVEMALDAAEIFEAEALPAVRRRAEILGEDSDARRRRLLGEAGLTQREWADRRQVIFARDGYVCSYCSDEAGPFHIDHMTPISRGGSWDVGNLCVACAPCNRSKKNRTLEEWGGR